MFKFIVIHFKILILLMLFLPTNALGLSRTDTDIIGSVEISYDDNINFDFENAMEDFITRVTLGLMMKFEHKLGSFNLEGNIIQELFQEYSTFNNLEENIYLHYQKELSKTVRLQVVNEFRHAEKIGTIDEAFGATPGLYEYYDNKFDVIYEKQLDKYSDISAGFSNEIYVVDREDIKDSFLCRVYFKYDHKRSSKTTQIHKYEFLNRQFIDGDDTYINSLTTGLRYSLTQTALLEGLLGGSLIHTFIDDTIVRPSILLKLTEQINARSSVNLSYMREGMPSRTKEDIFDQWRLKGEFRHKLSRQLNMSLSAFYGQGEFVDLNIEDNLLGAKFKLNYEIRPEKNLSLIYGYSTNDSDDETRNYIKNNVSLKFEMKF